MGRRQDYCDRYGTHIFLLTQQRNVIMTLGHLTRAALLCMVLSIVPSLFAAETGDLRQLGIGVISAKPDKRLKDHAALAEYLSVRLEKLGIQHVRIVVAKDIEEMRRLIKTGDVHVMMESALATIEMEKTGMAPALLAWRKGVPEYRTLFVARKDSSIKTLDDLKGKTIVFEDESSTSAYAIPIVELKKNSLRPVASTDGHTAGDSIRFLFAGEARNEAYWVAQGKADAAAFSDNDWDSLPEKIRTELRIIHATTPILRYVVSLRGNLRPVLKESIEQILLDMDKHPEGRLALKKASDTKKIERLTEDNLRSLDYVRGLIKLLD